MFLRKLWWPQNGTTKKALTLAKACDWEAFDDLATENPKEIDLDSMLDGEALAFFLVSNEQFAILEKLTPHCPFNVNFACEKSDFKGETVAWWLANLRQYDYLQTLAQRSPINLNAASTQTKLTKFTLMTVAHHLIEDKKWDLLKNLPRTEAINLSAKKAAGGKPIIELLLLEDQYELAAHLLQETIEKFPTILLKKYNAGSYLLLWHSREEKSLFHFLDQLSEETLSSYIIDGNKEENAIINFSIVKKMAQQISVKLENSKEFTNEEIQDIKNELSLTFRLFEDILLFEINNVHIEIAHLLLNLMPHPIFLHFVNSELTSFFNLGLYKEELTVENSLKLILITCFNVSKEAEVSRNLIAEILIENQRLKEALSTKRGHASPSFPAKYPRVSPLSLFTEELDESHAERDKAIEEKTLSNA